MRVESHNNLQDIRSFKATRVVIYDNFDQPVAAVVELPNNLTAVLRKGDKDFDGVMRQFGIDRTVVLERLDVPDPGGIVIGS